MEEKKLTIQFESRLGRSNGTGKTGPLTRLPLPESASAKLPARDSTMVEGTINRFPFRAALESDGNGGHRLKISEGIRGGAGADLDDAVPVEITRIGEEPETRVPENLRSALLDAPQAQEAWEDITPLARRDWILWIATAKKSETRQRRIEKACDMLASGKRRVCCFPGLKWLTKEHVTPDETWMSLPLRASQ